MTTPQTNPETSPTIPKIKLEEFYIALVNSHTLDLETVDNALKDLQTEYDRLLALKDQQIKERDKQIADLQKTVNRLTHRPSVLELAGEAKAHLQWLDEQVVQLETRLGKHY